MSHIFISYSHKDSVYVHKLAETLEKEGFAVWIDDRIDYGSEWPKVVTKNLDISNGVIVVLSNNSYESDMVQNEVARAREKKKHIFPLLLEGENWLIVQAKQFVDARDGSFPTEKFYKRLEEVSPRRKTIPPKNEATEKIALEKTERENAEKAAREKAERAAAEKLALENAEREKAEKAAREKADREAKRKITRESKPAPVNLRLLGIGGIILFVCILGGFGLNYLINLPVATATTFSPAPTKTSEVSQTSEVCWP